jgi:hypothetical protein
MERRLDDKGGLVDHVIVERLLAMYMWPEAAVPIHRLTVEELLTYAPQPDYVEREKRSMSYAEHCRRARFFYDGLLAGRDFDPIEVDNVCEAMRVYPEPTVVDGHHRLAACRLARARTVPAYYSGRVDLLDYLTGKRTKAPEL